MVTHIRVVVWLTLLVSVLSSFTQAAAVKVLESFSHIAQMSGDTVHATQRWRIRSFVEPRFEQDTAVYSSAPAALRVDGKFAADSSGTRFEISLRDEDRDLSAYESITVMIRPHRDVGPNAVMLRLTAGGVRSGFIPPVERRTLPADTWSRVTFSIAAIEARNDTTLLELYFGRSNHPSYTFHLDALTAESGGGEDASANAASDSESTVALDTPIWLRYDDVARRSPEWWRTEDGRALAERIVARLRGGEQYIDVPLGELTVPDGILATQLKALAYAYATSGRSKYKEAFVQGMRTLVAAQYPSGGWPTVYPKYKTYDLHGDMYAAATWNEIPTLLREVTAGTPPFDTDIVVDLDLAVLRDALNRIPPRELIKRFLYSDYSGRDAAWWASAEAARIGDNLISWQMPHGGWWENVAMAAHPYAPEEMRRSLSASAAGVEQGTFDDYGTIDPLRFLARLYTATQAPRYMEAFYRGLEYVLAAQYASGGWPQRYPDPSGYSRHVTFNDNVMVNIMAFIQDIVLQRHPFGFVDEAYRGRLAHAFARGLEYILAAQIQVHGRLTAWAQQHDTLTFQPQAGRSFEPVAISAAESTEVVKLLQAVPNPTDAVKQAILSALEWLTAAQLPDGRWARFYEIGTNRPLFVGRDGVIRYNLSEIDPERQSGYAWYGTWPARLVADVDYIDSLYEQLPHHPTVRVKILSPKAGAKVLGQLPLDVVLLHDAKAAGLRRVTIAIDDNVVHTGGSLPGRGELQIDTRQLADGRHTLTVETEHVAYGAYRQAVTFEVSNTWSLVQDMKPPIESAWLGVIDYLKAVRRSDGWAYETGQWDEFHGDGDRLVRASDTTDYLVWETPLLHSLALTVYARPETQVVQGVKLAVSADGEAWEEVAYRLQDVGVSSHWRKVDIAAEFSADDSWQWLRLTLSDAVPAESLQLGRLVITGYKQAGEGD